MTRPLISFVLLALLGACGTSPAPRYYTLGGSGADIGAGRSRGKCTIDMGRAGHPARVGGPAANGGSSGTESGRHTRSAIAGPNRSPVRFRAPSPPILRHCSAVRACRPKPSMGPPVRRYACWWMCSGSNRCPGKGVTIEALWSVRRTAESEGANRSAATRWSPNRSARTAPTTTPSPPPIPARWLQ